jgi:hypothetical protein
MKQITIVLFFFGLSLVGCRDKGARLPGDKKVATVWYNMQGCFGGERLILKMVANGEESFALLSEEGKEERRVKLNTIQQQAFKDFIAELKALKEETGCTTISRYYVQYNHETIAKVDGSCDWNGFDKLKNALFGDINPAAPADYPYREKQYTFEDIGSHVWTFSQSTADLSPEEWGGTTGQL